MHRTMTPSPVTSTRCGPTRHPRPGDVAAVNVVDEYRERAIDRFAQGSLGTAAGAGLIGLGKALGLHKETREAAEIREADEPEPDPDDPIHVNIDLQHPENTRIVYRLQTSDDETGAEPALGAGTTA